MIRLNDEPAKEEEQGKEDANDLASMINMALEKPEMRATAIYGDINEERCAEAIYSMLALDLTGTYIQKTEDGEEELLANPMEFYISTYGGQATEMFAVYDTMRDIRERVPIHTKGIGKVMSAGVLLLAAGTKGERRIGKNCRVMIHGVVAGQHGHIADIENEFSETKNTQSMYVKALAEETDMTQKYIKKLMERKTNVYLDAEEAVSLGIADIIV
jgi:ATP-dependent Clp protease protease subunit